MSRPFPANTTCDIYRSGNAPPSSPAVAGAAIHITGNFTWRLEGGEGLAAELRYTHVMLVEAAVDVRDGFASFSSISGPDTVYVPDQNGIPLQVVFVERRQRGTAQDHKRVYLHRDRIDWDHRVLVNCCTNKIAKTLLVTVSDRTGTCTCIPDTFVLTWSDPNWNNSTVATASCSRGTQINLSCDGSACTSFRLDCTDFAAGSIYPTSCNCQPWQLVYANVQLTGLCAGTVTFTITEQAADSTDLII